MNFPVVSETLIESIKSQVTRAMEFDSSYSDTVFTDMKNENPNLHDAILSTIKQVYMRAHMDPEDQNTVFLINNTINLCACIYQSLKQQFICDELEQ